MKQVMSFIISLLVVLILLPRSSFTAPYPGIPEFYPTVAEDISSTTWALYRFTLDKPESGLSLAFFAYNYFENKVPLMIRINSDYVTYTSDKDFGEFKWHVVSVPSGHLNKGENEIVFQTDSPQTNTWALAVEYAQNPAGSSKSTNAGVSWYSANLGYNYSVVGNYAVRILDTNGKSISVAPVVPDRIQKPSTEKNGDKDSDRIRQTTIGRYEPFSFSHTFSGNTLMDCMRDSGIIMDNAAGYAGLRRGEIIKKGNANAQLNIDRSDFEETDQLKTPWWLGEPISDTVRIKKELELDTTNTAKAYLMFYYQINAHAKRKGSYLRSEGGSNIPLHVLLNGTRLEHVYPDTGWRDRTEDWRLVEFPRNLLRSGLNEIVLHTDQGGDWRFAYENTVESNHSARSTDAGKTWDYDRLGENGNDNGEYLIRFWLDRYHKQGMVWSQPLSLGEKDDAEFRKRLSGISVNITVNCDLPSGSHAYTQVRFGSDFIPNENTWTDWEPPLELIATDVKPPDKRYRYMQWRVVLESESRLSTPKLTGVRVDVKGRRTRSGMGL